jgi:D-inositol-3-phosphate glycosyltransferase
MVATCKLYQHPVRIDKKMLRVAMISYHTCPLATLGGKDTGGMNVYVRDLTRYLGRLGVRVDVFTRSQDDHVPHILHDLGYGNRVVHVPSGPETWLPKPQAASYLPEFTRGILQFAREKGQTYDIIHSHYWMSGIAARDLKSAWQVPFVHMYHTLGLMKNRIATSEAEMEGSYRTEGEMNVLQNADRVIAATTAEASQLEFLYQADSSRLVIIPPGVDREHFYPIDPDEAKAFIEIPRDARMLLFVGRIEPLKGVDNLIQAISRLNAAGIPFGCPQLCLSIIGGEPDASPQVMDSEMQRLQSLCQELGLGDMVVFLGRRSQDSLPYYYSAAEVVVMPSHYESFGMVALEAMACGVPVVASQVGGLAYLVKDGITGYVVPDGDIDALSDCLLNLLTDPQRRQQMAGRAAEEALNYSWEKITGKILTLYENVLASKNY